MKHNIASLAVALSLAASLMAVPAQAVGVDTRLETIQTIGILKGDTEGNLNLSQNVTRAQFVTMMTAASPFRDTVGSGSNGAALFRDVKNTHWASSYIRLAVEQDWMSGYSDGTFRPERNITLEEACTALLRLLGYDASSFTGGYPMAQLSKAESVGLRDKVSAVPGQVLTRQNCVELFYALLLSDTSSGSLYGETQGYTIKNNEIDYGSLVAEEMEGPYITTDGRLELPFSEAAAVYRNSVLSSLFDVRAYDVYYYNESLRTVWVYQDRVTGTLTQVAPNRTAPTSVTVGGTTYNVGTTNAAYQLSSLGSFPDGSIVSLLLGMDGDVVGVISAQKVDTQYYGVVVSSEKNASTNTTTDQSTATTQITTELACTDGVVRTFYHRNPTLRAGDVAMITMDGNGTTVKKLTKGKSIGGTVSKDGKKLGKYVFASDVQILDVDSEGGYVRVYPNRLAGAELENEHILAYQLNTQGEIERLVLKEVTGDTWNYGYITKVQERSSGMNVSGTYEYIMDGTQRTVTGSTVFRIQQGGAMFHMDGNTVRSMQQLSSVSVEELRELTIRSKNKTYTLAEDVQVLLYEDGSYYVTTRQEINGTDYDLTAWYDTLDCPAGGRVRFLIAREK